MDAPSKTTRSAKKVVKRNRLSSVTAAVRLLKAFSEDDGEIGVSALAQRLKLAKSTVHRLAVTLVAEGLLEQNPDTGRYRLGIELFGLGALVRRRMDLSNEARPYLLDLRTRTGETIILGILADTEVIHVYDLESRQPLRINSDLGARRPAYCTALGRAILAFSPEETVERVLAGPLQRYTKYTVIDPKKIRSILAEVREKGFAISNEEHQLHIRSIAAPVRNAAGAVAGAIAVAAPSQRLTLEAMQKFAPQLLEVAASVSARLGGRQWIHP